MEGRAPTCSFCNRPQDEVRKLIAGPRAYICEECITLSAELVGVGPELTGRTVLTLDSGKEITVAQDVEEVLSRSGPQNLFAMFTLPDGRRFVARSSTIHHVEEAPSEEQAA